MRSLPRQRHLAKLQLYMTSILRYVTYCHIVWHFSKASDKRMLEQVQEHALRPVFNTSSGSSEALLHRAKSTKST